MRLKAVDWYEESGHLGWITLQLQYCLILKTFDIGEGEHYELPTPTPPAKQG